MLSARAALLASSGAVLAWAQACTIFDGEELRLQNGGGGAGPTGGGGAQVGAGGTGGEPLVGGTGGNPAVNCAEGVANGLCDTDLESCDCPDCVPTGLCTPGECVSDGSCGVEDSCTCTECDGSPLCGPTGCTDDDVCDPYLEGCICADCANFPDCADNLSACAGGAPDGMCVGPGGEQCSCVDCLGYPTCTPCTDDGTCAVQEGCFCADCVVAKNVCESCTNDGICYATAEECICPDCVGVGPCP